MSYTLSDMQLFAHGAAGRKHIYIFYVGGNSKQNMHIIFKMYIIWTSITLLQRWSNVVCLLGEFTITQFLSYTLFNPAQS